MLCRGSADEIPPADLAVLLAQSRPVYLLVDFNHLGIPLPEEIANPSFLFEWLEPPAARMVSPIVLTPEDAPSWPKWIREGWGKDAVVCLFSLMDKGAMLEHLRRACHAKGAPGAPGDGILGYCWPSVLPNLLSHGPTKLVQRLFDGIEAALVEFPDLPETWQVFGGPQIAELFEQMGFEKKPLEKAH
jgi:hypothetical protein